MTLEDEYVQNIVEQIKKFFNNLKFTVVARPISRRFENRRGFDWYFELTDLNKMFALQFKPPNEDRELSWNLEPNQHAEMQKRRYVFYCFPKERNSFYMPIILQRCAFRRATFTFRSVLHSRELRYYENWGTFASKVIECIHGMRLDTAREREIIKDDQFIDFRGPLMIFGLSRDKKELRIIANEKYLTKIM